MSSARENTPEWYRELAAYLRGQTFRDKHGCVDDERVSRRRLLNVQSVLIDAKYKRKAREMRKLIEAALDHIATDDETYIPRLIAENAEAAQRYEARAAELEAKARADVIPLNTAAMRQAQHIADSVAKAEVKREAAAATCSDDNLESNLRASLRADDNTPSPGAA